VVTYNPSAPPAKPAAGQVGKWVRTVRVGWNTTAFKCYIYNNMAFRLKYPANYDPTKSYPVLIFFHGKGEFGSVYDNEYQLYLGGQVHGNAVDGGKFNGFLLYPQSQTEFWSSTVMGNVYNLIDKVMVPQGLVDPFRVYVNGLSAGGGTTWSFLRRFVKLTAAITPISSASSTFLDSVHRYKFTPIFHFQGGLDTDPHPNTARALGSRILGVGGNYKYKEFATRGHDAWYPAWAEADYFPFYSRAHKANPWPLYGRTEFCQGTAFTDTLGVTPGFEGYEWRKNGVLIPGATSNTLVVNSFGTYDCRIKRGTVWSPWSPRPVVISAKVPTVQPTITTTGLVSRVIPAPDGSTTVPLEVPEGYASYTWQREGSTTTLSTTRFLKAASAGNYKVKVTETNGCGGATEFSVPFMVVDASGSNGPDAPTSLTATAISRTAIQVSWNQTATPAYNETGFEVYQATASGGPYTFRGLTAANATGFAATGLTSGVTYHFRVRAVNNNAASATVGPVSTATQVDNTAPTAPASLRLGVITRSSVELLWNDAADDVGVTHYDVYINGTKAFAATTTKHTVYNLVPATSYSFSVRARDGAGNLSPFSNTVNATTLTGTVTQDPGLSPANASNYSVRINMNADYPAAAPWNNTNILPAEGSVWNNFKNYSGLSAGVNMTIVENFSGVNPNGMNTGNNSGVYPDNVMRSSYYCGPGVTAVVRIDGLSLRHRYSFVFFGSRSGTGDRTSVYSIGAQKVSLNASNNTATTVQIDNITPDQNGTVTFTVSLGAAASFAYLNSLVIRGYYQAPTVTQSAVSDHSVATALMAEAPPAPDSTARAEVYPNPFTDALMVRVPLSQHTPVLQVRLSDATGRVVGSYTYRNLPQGVWQQRLPLSAARPGLYVIHLSGLPGGRTLQFKALKTK
jgi:chitodextrinase